MLTRASAPGLCEFIDASPVTVSCLRDSGRAAANVGYLELAEALTGGHPAVEFDGDFGR